MALTRPRAYQIYDIDYKQAVRVVTASNVTLSGGAPNSVDGVTLTLNDRVLVTAQSTGSQNGIYYVTTVGTGANGTWSRSIDTDATGELLSGTIVMVTEGTVYADTQWKLTTNDPITIGSTALTFVQNYLANSINAGLSNVAIGGANANVTVGVNGTSNVAVFSSTGVAVAGTLSASGNISANYFIGNGSQLTGIISGGTTTFSNTAPVSARAGDIWIQANSAVQYIYFNDGTSNQWAEMEAYQSFGGGSGGNGTAIVNGTSNVSIDTANGNITVGVGGTANVATISSNSLSVAGNITGSFILGNGSQLTGISAGGAGNARVMGYSLVFGG